MKFFIAYLMYVLAVGLVCWFFLIPASRHKQIETPIVNVRQDNVPSQPKSIVRLVDRLSGRTFCSGTVISDKTILTAGHCLLQAGMFGMVSLNKDPIDIRTSENKDLGMSGRAVWVSTQLDQGLLRGDFSRLPSRKHISDVHGILDERNRSSVFTTCGYPMGGHLFCTPFYYEGQFDFSWAGNGLIIPGMSGGPTLNSDGVVIGVNIAVQGPSAFISPLYEIDNAIQAVKEAK